jgi:murein DD-endopeptidase MepM/ murein hydrolase activator NlpD
MAWVFLTGLSLFSKEDKMAATVEVLITALLVIIVIFSSIFFLTGGWNNYIRPIFAPSEENQNGAFIHSGTDVDKLPVLATSPAGTLVWPIPTNNVYFITSCFGRRNPSNFDSSNCHPGIDINASARTPVLAAATGKFEQYDGDCLLLSHQSGRFYTRYCHVNSELNSKSSPGAGTEIATVKKDHVHFEVLFTVPSGTGKLTNSMTCTSNEKKDSAIVVFANPPKAQLGDYSSLGFGKQQPHLNPFCFFSKEIQKQAQFRQGDVSCLAETGGIGKGCDVYAGWLIKI